MSEHEETGRREQRQPSPPFRVDLVDQFQGHWEDGYSTLATYQRLEQAIALAKQITDEAIAEAGSFKSWYGMGDAGLVYDSRGTLVWDGIVEARKQHGQRQTQA